MGQKPIEGSNPSLSAISFHLRTSLTLVPGSASDVYVHGALVAYDATKVLVGGRLKQLFHSDAKAANDLGNFAKYSTPIVANGKVYVGTFSNKVVPYGL